MIDELEPNVDTMRFFEENGRKYRLYSTLCGAITCECLDPATGQWRMVSLREASPCELEQVLAARRTREDEEIARSIARHSA